MNNFLLAKPTLFDGEIDASVGEPYIIRDQLDNLFTLSDCASNYSLDIFEYQKPNGYLPLVKELEDKHQAPVIVCSGAKQAISALLYSIKKSGRNKIGLRTPYWALFKPLIEMHGLSQIESIEDSDSYLLVHPSNPDGYYFNNNTIEYYTNLCREEKKPFIHDAVYYSHVYLPNYFELKPIGDVQVFTFSKSCGLSGLRIGYAVFHNTELYHSVLEWMEHTTVGTSSLAQLFAYDLLLKFKEYPDSVLEFESRCYAQLQTNKQIASRINPAILDTTNVIDTHGMFLWAKCHNFQAFKDAKVNVIEGTPFGMPGYVRMNLALSRKEIQNIVVKLNQGFV